MNYREINLLSDYKYYKVSYDWKMRLSSFILKYFKREYDGLIYTCILDDKTIAVINFKEKTMTIKSQDCTTTHYTPYLFIYDCEKFLC